MKGRQKGKKKGGPKERVFGCDLDEHLQYTGQDVPQVLKSCTEFVEEHGVVDGIYRLSGISSNIQRLRQEFDTEKNPDLRKDVYLQDIHCISSLCKAYFRELPNPLLTYQLYDKFAEAVSVQLEDERLVKIKDVLKELPAPHYRTLEYLMKHLVHMASFSSQTNMHARNLAIVWAPNLLRSKDIEASGFNGTAAFMEVRVQSIVVEFILTHVEQLFEDKDLDRADTELRRKPYSPPSFPPITIATSDEMYFRTNVPSILTPGDGPAQMRPYHTILELSDQKRKGSVKVKKWRSIFNLGRSVNDAKRKSKEGKDEKTDKLYLRPAKSMDSLSSMPCSNEEQDGMIKKRSLNATPYRHESFGPQSKGDEQNEASDLQKSSDTENQQPVDVDQDSKDGKTHERLKSESEPNTPKPNRSAIMASPQGRSPKGNRNRAEKCAGVHISGPFSVTVPYHITSTLTLSALTSGRFITDSSDCVAPEKETSENLDSKVEQSSCQGVQNKSSAKKEEVKTLTSNTAENEEMKKEAITSADDVLDQFSFLDSQDVAICFDTSFAENEPVTVTSTKAPSTVKVAIGVGWAEGTESSATAGDDQSLDDDMEPNYMDDIMDNSMQMEEFSVEPPLDEDLYEPTTDEQGYTYYMANSFPERKCPSKEDDDDCNSEEVFLSADDVLDSFLQEQIACTANTYEENIDSSIETTLDEINKQDVHGSSGQHQDGQSGTTVAVQEQSSPKAVTAVMESPECSNEPEVSKLPVEPMAGNNVSLDTIPQFLDLQPNPCAEVHSSNTDTSFISKLHPEDCNIQENRNCNAAEMSTEKEGKKTSTAESNQQCTCFNLGQIQPISVGPLITEEDSNAIRYQQEESPQGQDDSISGCSALSGNNQCPNYDEQLTCHTERACIGEPLNEITDESSLFITECTSGLHEPPPQQLEEQHFQNDIQLFSQEPGEEMIEETHQEFYHPLELSATNTSEQPPLFNNCNSNQLEPFFTETPKEELGEHRWVSCNNGVRMSLTSSKIRVHNIKAVPVVPPKPQFAKLPPALKSKFQVNALGSGSGDGGLSSSHSPRASREEELDRSCTHDSSDHAAVQKQMRRSSWRNKGSKSFDTAVTSVKDRQFSQIPVRRMQTFCSGDSYETLDLAKLDRPFLFSKPYLKPLSPGTRSGRPQSCLGPPSPSESMSSECYRLFPSLKRQTSHDAMELNTFETRQDYLSLQETHTRNRLSMPKISHKSDLADIVPPLPQRRSLAFEIKDSKQLD
ncbi:rho GTPase-activating protein 30 isoform X2 [Protopterus annectens]|uniref:rho GTPase-activating protein 30 isoform X2 n=1 Tax=Protopterus annectens TaxID=7888 RepID=UPI001CFBD2B4|nr:rho GTPase-activating protein 30 isoform X2 [Protopterus annectens]